jgi:hypothetical protein
MTHSVAKIRAMLMAMTRMTIPFMKDGCSIRL